MPTRCRPLEERDLLKGESENLETVGNGETPDKRSYFADSLSEILENY